LCVREESSFDEFLIQNIRSVEETVPSLLSSPLAVLLEKDSQLKKESEELKAKAEEKKAIVLKRISALNVGETEEQITIDGVSISSCILFVLDKSTLEEGNFSILTLNFFSLSPKLKLIL
jgi:hypothetical protein